MTFQERYYQIKLALLIIAIAGSVLLLLIQCGPEIIELAKEAFQKIRQKQKHH